MILLDFLRRHASSLAAAGATIVAVENAALLAGLGAILSGSAVGLGVVRVALALDLAGITLLGIGFVAPRSHRLRVWSGVLCLVWVALTVAWRVAGLAALGGTLEAAGQYPGDAPETFAALGAAFASARILLAVWIAASVALALAAVLFARSLKPAPVAWPFFAILSAAATVFLAANLYALLDAGASFPLLATAIYLKLAAVPVVGVVAYAALTRTLLRTPPTRGEEPAQAS